MKNDVQAEEKEWEIELVRQVRKETQHKEVKGTKMCKAEAKQK